MGRVLSAQELDVVRGKELTVGARRRHADGRGRWSVTIFAYVDDHPIIADSDETLEAAFKAMDELAAELGVSFKLKKDIGRPCVAKGESGLSSVVALGARFTSEAEDCVMTLRV